MFGFDLPVVKDSPFAEDGSQLRFHERKAIFVEKEMPPAKHDFWWIIHNCVAHPLIGVFPTKVMFDLHDWTSRRIMAVPLENKS